MSDKQSGAVDTFCLISAVQAVFICILILSVLIIKSLSPSFYEDVKEEFLSRFGAETDISQVLGEDDEI